MPRMFRHVFVLSCLTGLTLAFASLAGAYTVQSGDTLGRIAQKHGVSVQDLLKANKGLDPKKMKIGVTLVIPGAGEKGTKQSTKATEKKSRRAEPTKETSKAAKEHKSSATTKEKPSASKEKSGSYVVKKGETLGGIAAKFGVSSEALLKANKGLNPRRIHVGQQLTLPGSAKETPPAETASTKSSRKAEKASSAPETSTYTVHHRETPNSVAKKFHISVKELAKLNPRMGKKLHRGEKLTVPLVARAERKKTEEKEPEVTLPPATTPEVASVSPPKATPAPSVPTLPDSKKNMDAETAFEKGIEFGKQNKFQKAVEAFDKAIKLNPDRADYYASRGHAHYYLKQYAKAIDDYTKAIARNPNFALAYSMRGLSHTRSGQYPQAIEDFNRAIALGPKEADYYKGRGFTYLHLKQAERMCQDYKKACDLGDCELLDSARKEKACQ